MDGAINPTSPIVTREMNPVGLSNQPHRKPKTRSRISAACIRCQRRKIRCDGILPSCGGCQKAGVRCVDGGTSREIPRNYLSELEVRVAWLESIVRDRCPDVDLAAGPGWPSHTKVQTAEPPERHSSRPSQGNSPTHEITEQMGLISVAAGSDLRYLGPSSGLFFTRFVLEGLSRAAEVEASNLYRRDPQGYDDLFIPSDMVEVQAKEIPSDRRHTTLLSRIYFETVHLQYPFLHEHTYMDIIRKFYEGDHIEPEEEFQVLLVLAIGATLLSRRSRRPLSAEGFYASAMQRLDSIFRVASLAGVQCMLLLEMYAMHNPSSGLNLWTLHYHSLSSALELGLQRDVQGLRHFSHLQQDLRTRVFWSVYSMDRLLSITMGRPIGLVDEQCDMRLPMDANDDELALGQAGTVRHEAGSLTNMTTAIHLFKLSRFKSEIKCVLYCIDRKYPPYSSPSITDIKAWHQDFLNRLRIWRRDIPKHPEGDRRQFMNDVCEIKYHELIMLVLRPSPIFQQPAKAAIHDCFASAIECIKLYAKLYRENKLQYGWISVHSLFLCVITIFYCVWTPNGVASEVDFDSLTSALKSASDILSATGEYWPEATRSRDVLDHIFAATMRRFSQRQDQRAQQPSLPAPRNMPSTQPAIGAVLQEESQDNLGAELPSHDFSMTDIPAGMPVNFPPYASMSLDSFISTDWLSYFMSSEEHGNAGLEGFGNFNVMPR